MACFWDCKPSAALGGSCQVMGMYSQKTVTPCLGGQVHPECVHL